MVIERVPLEDELGDVLDKALRNVGLSENALAEQVGIEVGRLRDAIDYRYDLSPPELHRLARALGLNETGLLAIAGGHYPLPEIAGLPFCVYPLRMPHGIGVANAYLVADCRSQSGILFDSGTDAGALRRVWPPAIRELEAIFITHDETEHSGGIAGVIGRFGRVPVFGPGAAQIEFAASIGEGASLTYDGLQVDVLSTPGHAEAHNSYLVRSTTASSGVPLLVCGDVLFAGSVGGGYYCHRRLSSQVVRILQDLPPETVIAPGHGPLTTIKNERMFNPFVL